MAFLGLQVIQKCTQLLGLLLIISLLYSHVITNGQLVYGNNLYNKAYSLEGQALKPDSGYLSNQTISGYTYFLNKPSRGEILKSLSLSSETNDDVADRSILLTQVLFRHGDRSSIHSYPLDPHKNDWPQGLGQLTKIGMNQAYQLGRYLRQHYQDFLGQDYNRNEVYIRSTNLDRTLMTAECVASGLFPLNMDKKDNFTSSWPLGTWQPIPIQTVPEEDDKLLHPAHACERINNLRKVSFPEEQILLNDKDLMFKLSQHTGMDMNISSLHFLADIVFCQKSHDMIQPAWMTPDIEEKLMNYRARRAKIAPADAKYLSGTLLNTLIQNMLKKAANESDPHKMYLYSAHDSTVGPLLSQLGHDDEIQVPYTAAVIIELHKVEEVYSVKLFYRNDTTVPPYKIVPYNCSNRTSCPLDTFHEAYKHHLLTDEEWENMCQHSPSVGFSVQDSVIPILVAVLVAFIGLDIFLVFKAYKYWQRQPEVQTQGQYTLLQTEEGASDSEADNIPDSDGVNKANNDTFRDSHVTDIDEVEKEMDNIS